MTEIVKLPIPFADSDNGIAYMRVDASTLTFLDRRYLREMAKLDKEVTDKGSLDYKPKSEAIIRRYLNAKGKEK